LGNRRVILLRPSVAAQGPQLATRPVLADAADRGLLNHQFILQPAGQDDGELTVGDDRLEVLGRSNTGTRRSYVVVSSCP
jgi:hypothetical protein